MRLLWEVAVRARGSERGVVLARLFAQTRSMFGVVHLDWRGRIVKADPRAGEILRRGDGLTTRGGVLHARRTADDTKLGRRLARAPPPVGGRAFGGSMTVDRTASSKRFSLHVRPMAGHRTSFGIGRVAALVPLFWITSRTIRGMAATRNPEIAATDRQVDQEQVRPHNAGTNRRIDRVRLTK